MATIKFVYRSEKERANGEAPLYLRIYHKKKLRYKKTDIILKEKHWNDEKQEIRKSHPKSTSLNLHLNGWKARAREAIRGANPLTAKNIKYQLEGKNPDSYFDYVDRILPSFGYDYRKLIGSATEPLKEFAPGLTLSGVSVSFLKEFEQHLKQSISQNSANQYLGVIRRVLNRAIDDEIITPSDSPFMMRKIKMTWEQTDPTPLTWDQFVTLRDFDPPEELQLYKDMFLFSVYMDGMRLTDVLTFEVKGFKDGSVEYKMSKTAKKKIMKVVPPARDIIDKYNRKAYLFPLLNYSLKGDDKKDAIRNISAELWVKIKKLGELAELDVHLHFHMARNTSAYIAYKKGGWSLPEIQNMLGHSTINQTRHYLGKLAPEEIDQKREDMWG